MKKFLIHQTSLIIFALTIALGIQIATNSANFDTTTWYSYSGYTNLHSFAIRFPTDWQVYTIDDELQALSPNTYGGGEHHILIEEFQGKSLSQVIDHYKKNGFSVLKSEDELFPTKGEDLIARKVTYVNVSNNEEKVIHLLKRGSLIIALVENVNDYPDTVEEIISSFYFSDNWDNYLDLEHSYSFIFPANFSMTQISNGVSIGVTSSIFKIEHYENQSLDDAITSNLNDFEIDLSQEEIFFHTGDAATEITFKNTQYDKNFVRIYIKNGDDFFVLTGTNIEDNFPHANTYDDYILEMIQSFQFFDVELDDSYTSFKKFPDIRDTHPNATAINHLSEIDIIEGYDDGSFKPDDPINRAELTKMLVASKANPDPDKYNNCFPDVADEWFARYICYAKEKGWVQGYSDETFRPAEKINRVEALKIILEAMYDGQISDSETLNDRSVLDVDPDQWYGKYFSFADNHDLLDKQHITSTAEGYTYEPSGHITRKELAETIYRALEE